MSVPAPEIDGFFNTYGWDFRQEGEDLFRTGFVGDVGHFDVWLRVTEDWLFFSIQPYIPLFEGKAHGTEVLSLLLYANHELSLAKFALDEDGDLVLAVELPAKGFGYSHFADALTALSHYADLFHERFMQAIQKDHVQGH